MNLNDIAWLRLINQHLAAARCQTPAELVNWMGAIQAQDYAMALWAVGVRLPGTSAAEVETALDQAQIIRTHVLRPTWHLVSAQAVYWMLELAAPQIQAVQKSRHIQLGLTQSILQRSNVIIEKALVGGKSLTREALVIELERGGIATEQNRAAHLLAQAELEGILGSGAAQGGKPTYALLEERVPKPKPMSKEEGAATLARIYFNSRGPATLADFKWWSGLPAGAAKRALDEVKADFESASVETQTFWFSGPPAPPPRNPEAVYLLPAYDELIISYKDRQASLPLQYQQRMISSNGIFWPVIVVNGQVSGTWKRTQVKGTVRVETQLFERLDPGALTQLEKAAGQYGAFLGKQVEVRLQP